MAQTEQTKKEVHKLETRWQNKYDKLAMDFTTLRKDVQARSKEQKHLPSAARGDGTPRARATAVRAAA